MRGARTTSRRVIGAVAALAVILAVAGTVSAHPGAGGRHIVVLADGASVEAVLADHGVVPSHVYRHALRGFAAPLGPAAAARLSADPRVARVEADQRVSVAAQTLPTGIERIFANGNPTIDIDGTDDRRVDVDVAIIDTGIDYTHPDLNVVARTNCARGGPFGGDCKDNDGTDGNGHGTHVAGTTAALDNGIGVVGVAPGARLHAVRVLGNDGSGWMSWIIAGVNWVTARASQIEVANMSLGCECSSASLDQAITNSVAAGVVYAVAAGNDNKNSSTFSPGNHSDVITTSALADFDGKPGALAAPTCRSDEDDTLANFSNWGPGVEVAAPGVCINSTWKGGGYSTISGTSMASPHVAGAAALLASVNNPNSKSDVNAIRATIISKGNFNWTDDSGDGIKEPLLDVSDSATFAPATVVGPAGSPNAPPTASFTYSCTNLACDFNGSGSSDTDGTIASYAWNFGDGSNGAGVTVSHTYASAGTYSVTLTVTDNGGATGDQTQSVSVTAPSGGGGESKSGMHVGDLDGSGSNGGSSWTATVLVLVHDAAGAAVSGANVTFSYVTQRGTTGGASCATDGSGWCTASVAGIAKRDGSVTFTVTSVTKSGQTYVSSDNHDPDGDSNGTVISVAKP